MIHSILEMLQDMENGVYDFTKDGKCSNCGGCCSRFLPVSKREIRNIRKYILKHRIKQQKHIVSTATQTIDFICPFRDNTEKKCVIYAVRPAICKDFQCDKPRKKIEADKTMYHGRYDVVDMTYEFFGGK